MKGNYSISQESRYVWIAGLLALLLLAACGNPAQNDSKPLNNNKTSGSQEVTNEGKTDAEAITFVLDWYPNTNHTGLYVALDKGYFAEQGLDVEIIEPGENTADLLVASGSAQFGISYQESITQARAQQIPLVSLAAIIQHNTSAYASLKEAGIESVADLAGKRYGGWGSAVEEAVLQAVMEHAGVDAASVENVTMGAADFFSTIGKTSDFQWIYYGWDGVEAERRGMELNVIMLKDLHPALDYYTPVLSTSEAMIQNNPDTVRRFVQAVSDGYRDATNNPQEAADILLKHVPEMDVELVQASQAWLADKYQDDAEQWGYQQTEVWTRYADWMLERGLIAEAIDVEAAFTNSFLPAPTDK